MGQPHRVMARGYCYRILSRGEEKKPDTFSYLLGASNIKWTVFNHVQIDDSAAVKDGIFEQLGERLGGI